MLPSGARSDIVRSLRLNFCEARRLLRSVVLAYTCKARVDPQELTLIDCIKGCASRMQLKRRAARAQRLTRLPRNRPVRERLRYNELDLT